MWDTAFRVSTQRVTDALLRKPVLPSGAKAFERISGAMCVRSALASKGEQTLIFLVPEATATPARQVTACLLVGDHAHAHGDGELPPAEVRRLLKGDVLLVTQAVSETKNVLDELPIGAYQRLKDCWDVIPASKYSNAQRRDKPRLLVANPGWVAKSAAGRRFGAVVIDASHPRTLEQLPELVKAARGCSSLRFVVAPPASDLVLRACGYPDSAAVWFWDPEAQADAEVAVETKTSDATRASERNLWVCDSDAVATASLENLHLRLCEAARAAAGAYYPGLQQTWGIYNRLRQLVVPLAHLEEAAATTWSGNLRARIDDLAAVSGHGTVAWDTTWPKLFEATTGAYETLLQREETAKFWAMAATIEKSITVPGKLLRIVVPSEAEGELVTPLLGHLVDGFAAALSAGRLEIVTTSQEARLVAEGRVAPTVLLGPRTKNRHLDAFPTHDVEVLVYPHEVAVERAHLAKLYEPWTRATDETRAKLLAPLGLRPINIRPEGSGACAPRLNLRRADGHQIAETSRSEVTWDIDLDALAAGGSAISGDYQPTLSTEAGDVVEVSFSNGTKAAYYAGQNVDVFFPASQTLQRYSPQALQPGWKVVSFVDGRYDTLFQRLTEIVAVRRPAKERALLELWDAVKRQLAQRNPNRLPLYERLTQRGLKSSYETFTSWLRKGEDEVVAPRHFEEFKVLADESGAFKSPELLEDTFHAVQHERGRNRVAGRTLKNFLRAVVSGDGYDEALSSARKLDTALSDVLVAVEVLDVASIKTIPRRSQ